MMVTFGEQLCDEPRPASAVHLHTLSFLLTAPFIDEPRFWIGLFCPGKIIHSVCVYLEESGKPMSKTECRLPSFRFIPPFTQLKDGQLSVRCQVVVFFRRENGLETHLSILELCG